MYITTKGQVTIPAKIRNEMGFLPNTEVEFKVEDGEVKLVRKTESKLRGKSIVSRLKGKANTKLSTDEIMALTRAES